MILTPQRVPVADRLLDLRRGVADDDADVVDAGVADGLDHAKQDRLVGHRHQLLGAGVGDRVQARALAAAQNQSLHRRSLTPYADLGNAADSLAYPLGYRRCSLRTESRPWRCSISARLAASFSTASGGRVLHPAQLLGRQRDLGRLLHLLQKQVGLPQGLAHRQAAVMGQHERIVAPDAPGGSLSDTSGVPGVAYSVVGMPPA